MSALYRSRLIALLREDNDLEVFAKYAVLVSADLVEYKTDSESPIDQITSGLARVAKAFRRSDHRIGYALAVIVIVLVGGELLANRFQRRRHVGQRALIELDQHGSSMLLPQSESLQAICTNLQDVAHKERYRFSAGRDACEACLRGVEPETKSSRRYFQLFLGRVLAAPHDLPNFGLGASKLRSQSVVTQLGRLKTSAERLGWLAMRVAVPIEKSRAQREATMMQNVQAKDVGQMSLIELAILQANLMDWIVAGTITSRDAAVISDSTEKRMKSLQRELSAH